MKIRYKRSGGFANITTLVDLDSAQLPPGKATEIHALVEQARVFDQPEKLPRRPAIPDDFEHSLEITDGRHRHKIRRSDSQCPPELIRLFDRLQVAATTKAPRAPRSRRKR